MKLKKYILRHMPQQTKDISYKIRVVTACVLLGMILVGLAVFGEKPQSQKDKEAHYHAGFRIYLNNELINYSKPEHMHIEPCGEEDTHEERDNPSDRAHLHDLIGDVVHVHSSAATWGDLLKNLRFNATEMLIFYLNGVPVENLLDKTIVPYDRMLLMVGVNSNIPEKLESVPNRAKIEQAEQETEGC